MEYQGVVQDFSKILTNILCYIILCIFIKYILPGHNEFYIIYKWKYKCIMTIT